MKSNNEDKNAKLNGREKMVYSIHKIASPRRNMYIYRTKIIFLCRTYVNLKAIYSHMDLYVIRLATNAEYLALF